jgi:3',5'-cyclic AMP phosphodiesterase CpdA
MKSIKFAVFTDLHYDHIFDGDKRLQFVIDSVKKNNIDFLIELGDLCYPTSANKVVLEQLKQLGIPCYYVLGNHDSDAYSRDEVLKFLGLKNSYYSFSIDRFKFIVLDACYIKTPYGVEPYFKRNFDKCKDAYPYLPPEELEWLKNELAEEDKYYILFSHHSLANGFMNRGIYNRAEVREILEKRNENSKRVLLCMNGHDHGDAVYEINGISYYTLNSMSYIWHGMKETFNYSEEIHAQYPYLKDMIIYNEGLHTIVTASDEGHVKIEGMTGNYQNIAPSDIGLADCWNGVSIKPVVSALSI